MLFECYSIVNHSFMCLSTPEHRHSIGRQMCVDIVVSSEDMSRLDMSNSVVSKMVVVVPMVVVVVVHS